MHITAVILAALVTTTMASPKPMSPNELTNTLQTLERRAGNCPCFPDCGCPSGTSCFCEPDNSRHAPCYPNCGCPTGLTGTCIVSDSPFYGDRLYSRRSLTAERWNRCNLEYTVTVYAKEAVMNWEVSPVQGLL